MSERSRRAVSRHAARPYGMPAGRYRGTDSRHGRYAYLQVWCIEDLKWHLGDLARGLSGGAEQLLCGSADVRGCPRLGLAGRGHFCERRGASAGKFRNAIASNANLGRGNNPDNAHTFALVLEEVCGLAARSELVVQPDVGRCGLGCRQREPHELVPQRELKRICR